MKRFIGLCVVLLAVGCGSMGGYEAPAPRWIRERPPRGAIWGIGAARNTVGAAALPLAQSRGRIAIARQLDAIARETLQSYASGQGAPADLAERTGRRIISMNMARALVLTVWKSPDGRWWCRMSISAEDAQAVIMEALTEESSGAAGFDRAGFQALLARRLARRALRPPVIND